MLAGCCVAHKRGCRTVELSSQALGAYQVTRDPFLSVPLTVKGLNIRPLSSLQVPLALDVCLRSVERAGALGLHERLCEAFLVVSGYCQSPSPNTSVTQVLPDFLSAIRGRLSGAGGAVAGSLPPVVVHVRGGDALLPVNRDRYALSENYYRAAIARFGGEALVFSDDASHAESLLIALGPHGWRYAPSRTGEDYLLACMSAEGPLVLSRSTLSFWGGMLSTCKEVFIPADYPRSWRRLLTAAGKTKLRTEEF